MKKRFSPQLSTAALLFVVATLSGVATDSAAPAKDNATPAADEEEVVVLCGGGFVVSDEEGTGYKASETLPGVNHQADLRDLEACISVVTEDFLNDVGTSSRKDLLVYADESKEPPAPADKAVAPLGCVDVSSGSSGYVASDTLPGNGVRPVLKDICADPSVVTAEFLQGPAVKPVLPDHPRMEVVFVLDTTGSMGAMIESAKQKIWSIANQLKSAQPTPEIRFGLVAYRDRGDAYVTKVYDLGSDLDSTYAQLTEFVADGGGDGPESVNEALANALHKIEWTNDTKVLRAIFLVGDMPPHIDYENDVQWTDSCREASERGILINTLQCGTEPETTRVWREIAAHSGGAYTAMLQEGHATAIETSADKEIGELTRALNGTVIAYGNPEDQARASRNAALVASMSAEGIADRSAFLNKTEAGAVMSGKGDLVAELIAGRMTLGDVDQKQLDSRLATLPLAERNAEITKQVERRRELQASLQKLIEQREKEVAETMKAAEGTEDIVVLSPFCVMQEQAEAAGYHFKK